jgi:phage FluMu gp28-like protein
VAALGEIPGKIKKASLAFVEYQRRWLADKSRLKIMVKSRRIGGSEVATFSGACKAVGYDVCTGILDPSQGATVNIISASHRQARDMLRRCAEHVQRWDRLPDDIDRAIAIAKRNNLPLTPEVIEAICDELKGIPANAGYVVSKTKRKKVTANQDDLIWGDPSADRVRLANGAELRAFAANPRTIRSFEGHVILDEFGVMPYAAQIWAAAKPVSMATLGYPQGFTIEVIGTPCGDDTMFFELSMTDAGKRFSRHRVDIYRAVRDGFPLEGVGPDATEADRMAAIEGIRVECGLQEIFDEEYCCNFNSSSSRYIPREIIDKATYRQPQLRDEKLRHHFTATSGLDVAESSRTGADPCALVRNYKINGRQGRAEDYTYWMDDHVQTGRGVSFATQEEWVNQEFQSGGVHRAAVDATGIGRDLAKRLVAKFGSQVLAVNFDMTSKEIMATRCKWLFEAGRQRIPDNAELIRGLLNLHRIIARDGVKPVFQMKRDKNKEGGHGDTAWALMLAQHAAEQLGGLAPQQSGWGSRAIPA